MSLLDKGVSGVLIMKSHHWTGRPVGAGFPHPVITSPDFAWHTLALNTQPLSEWMTGSCGPAPCRAVPKQLSIWEHIPGSPEEREKAGKRTDARFWNLQSRCSMWVYDFWLKTIKLGYFKKKKASVKEQFVRMIKREWMVEKIPETVLQELC